MTKQLKQKNNTGRHNAANSIMSKWQFDKTTPQSSYQERDNSYNIITITVVRSLRYYLMRQTASDRNNYENIVNNNN